MNYTAHKWALNAPCEPLSRLVLASVALYADDSFASKFTTSEIINATCLAKSSVLKHLSTLCGLGLITKVSHGEYLINTPKGYVAQDCNDSPDVCSNERSLRKSKSKVDTGHIYLVREVNGIHHKIGRAKDIDSRLSVFSVKLPFKVDLAFSFMSGDYKSAEAILHEHFASYRVDGEWFNLSEDHIEQIKDMEFLKSLGIDVVSAGGML